MHSAVGRIDVVGETQLLRFEFVFVQKSGLHLHSLGGFVYIEWDFLERFVVATQVFDKRKQAAIKLESIIIALLFVALINSLYSDAFCQKCLLPQMIQDTLAVKFYGFENFGVGFKNNFGTRGIAFADFSDFILRLAALVFLLVNPAVAVDLRSHPSGKGADCRHAHAVKASGNFVGLSPEFAAGMQGGQNGGESYKVDFFVCG